MEDDCELRTETMEYVVLSIIMPTFFVSAPYLLQSPIITVTGAWVDQLSRVFEPSCKNRDDCGISTEMKNNFFSARNVEAAVPDVVRT